MGKFKSIVTNISNLNIISAEKFVAKLLEKKYDRLATLIAERELLDVQYDESQPAVVRVPLRKPMPPFGSSALFEGDTPIDEETFEVRIIKFKKIGNNPVSDFKEQLAELITFNEMDYIVPHSIGAVAEQCSLYAIEDFQSPNYLIDFGDGRFAAIFDEDLSIKMTIHHGEIKGGIIPNQHTFYGVRTKDMK